MIANKQFIFLGVILQVLILCVGHELFILMRFIWLELEIKNSISFVTCTYRGKFIFSYGKLKMVSRTHCLAHDIQSKTRELSRFLEKSKTWDCHFCCAWDGICFLNNFYCALFSMAACILFIFIVIFYWSKAGDFFS